QTHARRVPSRLYSRPALPVAACGVHHRRVAQMAELVDAPGSGPGGGNTVEVRVLFWAPFAGLRMQASRFAARRGLSPPHLQVRRPHVVVFLEGLMDPRIARQLLDGVVGLGDRGALSP